MNREPVTVSVAVGGVLTTGVALAAVLWPHRLDPALQAAIIAFGNAVILALATLFARARSTPVASPRLPEGSAVRVEGTDDTVIVKPTPPGPVGVDASPR